MDSKIGGVSITYNVVNLLLLIVFIFHFRVKKGIIINYKLSMPFLFLYGLLLYIALFSTNTPVSYEMNIWRISFMQTIILPLLIWNYSIYYPKSLVYIKWSLIISILIAGVYGLVLTQFAGLNPYTQILSLYYKFEDYAYLYSTMKSKMSFSTASKIQSTMIHPMTWALTLSFMFVVFQTIYQKTKKNLYLVILLLIVANLIVCGVRTAIAALIISYILFLLRQKNLKVVIWGILAFSVMAVFIFLFDDLFKLFSSFFDFSGKNAEVEGSSLAMRFDQIKGAFKAIEGNVLVGNGYAWNQYYQSIHGDHPVMLAFESLILVVLSNSGYFGVLVWVFFGFLVCRVQRKVLKNRMDILTMDNLLFVYIFYAIGTGEFSYIQFFVIYYAFLLGYLNNKQKVSLNNARINRIKNTSSYEKIESHTKVSNSIIQIK
jgi:hypothetical protein